MPQERLREFLLSDVIFLSSIGCCRIRGRIKLELKDLLKYKTVLVLFVIIALNAIAMSLLLRVDSFVNVDLYRYGLIFNYQWADEYWHNNLMLWTFIGASTAMTVTAIVPHFLHSRTPSRFSRMAGFVLPALSIAFQAISVFFFYQINNIVWSGLYDFGVQYNIDWATTYNPISMPALTLMVVALLITIFPAVRALGIIEIEIVHEEE